MIDNIVICYGSKKDFENILAEKIGEDENTIPFMQLIQHYNARLRPNESGVRESQLANPIKVDNCIVRTEDYGSVFEHVISNFVNIVCLNHDVGTLYMNNPPKRVVGSLSSVYHDEIEYIYSEYGEITRLSLQRIYKNLNKNILGQNDCKNDIISGLYKLTAESTERPAVLMLYGPSGVGKTETAKCISETLGGGLLRVQFSMMQTIEAYNYVFGAEHSKGSFARDLISRESNVILIDEFDKVSPNFYNAFYELFDEGRFVDGNYDIDLRHAVFICTCNFSSEDEIKKTLGPAMFSRIGCCIGYKEIGLAEKHIIIEKWYKAVLSRIKSDEKEAIEKTDILNWFKENANRYDNIRILKTKLEKAIFDELTDIFIASKE